MATVFIIAHAPLASALKATAEHLGLDGGPLLVLDVQPGWSIEETVHHASGLLAAHPADAEILLLADVFHATPCTAARSLANGRVARVLCGVNVPMLWSLLGRHLNRPLDELVQRALGTGKDGVMHVPAPVPQAQRRPTDSHAQDHGHHQ